MSFGSLTQKFVHKILENFTLGDENPKNFSKLQNFQFLAQKWFYWPNNDFWLENFFSKTLKIWSLGDKKEKFSNLQNFLNSF